MTEMTKEDIIVTKIRLFHAGDYGMLGGFEQKLIHAIIFADGHNRKKLALGFPEYVAAVEKWEKR